jgi:hypothetical protein
MQKVTTGTTEKGINNLEWIDREGWRRKTSDTESCENLNTLYINNNNNNNVF